MITESKEDGVSNDASIDFCKYDSLKDACRECIMKNKFNSLPEDFYERDLDNFDPVTFFKYFS